MSMLNDFFNQLRRAGNIILNRREIDKRRSSTSLAEHFVVHNDFPEFFNFLTNALPDPDEVLKNANLTPMAYRDIFTDAHAGAVVSQRKTITKQSELVWTAGKIANEKEPTRQAQGALDEVTAQIRAITKKRPLIDINSEVLDAPVFGMSPMELFWEGIDSTTDTPFGRKIVTNILQKPFEWFGYSVQPQVFGVKDRLTASNFVLIPVPPGKFINVRHNATYRNPYGDRFAKRMFWPWTFKKGGFTFWAEFIEKYGMPFLHGKLAPGKNDADQKAFLEDLTNMVRNGILVSRSEQDGQEDKVETIETGSRSGSTQAHDIYTVTMNGEMSKAGLGETLTIENKEAGSQAATRIHADMLENLQSEDKVMTEGFWNTLAEMIAVANFGSEVPAPTAKLINERQVMKRRADRDEKLSDKLGVLFRKSYISKSYGLSENEFELTRDPDKTPETPPVKKPTAPDNGNDDTKEDIDDATRPEASEFGEPVFTVQEGLDSFLNTELSKIRDITKPQVRKIKEILRDTDNFDSFMAEIAAMSTEFNQVLLTDTLATVLNVHDVVGEWAVNNNRI